MKLEDVENGLRVRTVFNLRGTNGMTIAKKNLDARTTNALGTVRGWVPGHGGDVWWVQHDNGTVGAYVFDEFNPE